MSEWLDTIMNIEVFAFIALLVWLYFAPIGVDSKDRKDKPD
ncbi:MULTISPECIES: hypothetical protein [Pseudovibrio]|nr:MULTISPECIES: hypothetical protein [Pseudovibrio]MDD7910898.1 hypothetical protein [Pseudovibrio exalbescens]MDX5593389.1 hypothetical protein [Pseudovibrio sp. SPO723]